MMLSAIDHAYRDFASAIVKKAAEDYRKALNGKGYNKKSSKQVIKEVERFFHSHYFEMLTSVSGDYLIEKLQQEHDENERSNHESNISASNT